MTHATSRTRLRRTALVAGAFLALATATATGTAQAAASAAASTSAAARPASGPRIAAAPSSCPKYYFCGYKNANYSNLSFKFRDCYLQAIPTDLISGGSWYNNQSNGTKAKMYDYYKNLIYTTPGAPYGDAHGDWSKVWYVDAC
ncbi:hypothetical protein ABZS71_27595 [Streptomyces sp. NPDC005393]|uniref:hypothetical protein n=1 Tax=Streptomyces sp. NPDC005393 TaxID=3157041 RepID=UPI0033BBEE50